MTIRQRHLQVIRDLVSREEVRLTIHARSEMDQDEIATEDLFGALTRLNSEIIEDYPEDKRGHSHLVLGWLPVKEPVHVCCSIHEEEVVIITVYRPDPAKWSADWRTRK